MRRRAVWLVLGMMCVGAGLWLWREVTRPDTTAERVAAPVTAPAKASAHSTSAKAYSSHITTEEREKLRLSNTKEKGDTLLSNDRVILLANAVIDTRRPLDGLGIPDTLRAGPDNRSWLVQARGTVADPAFQAVLRMAGAEVISYIPNDADLVRMPATAAQQLAGNPLVAGVVPYEPYYKLADPGLLKLAVAGNDLPSDVGLRVGVYAGAQTATLRALAQLHADVTARETSPFGTILTVHPAAGTFLNVAQLDGVMVMEAARQRVAANDLTRPRLGVSVNSVTNVNYLSLNGSGIMINVNDSGADINQPDLAGRVILDSTASGTDPIGHGTHTIGTMIGNGSQSATVGTNAAGSVTNAQFSGMASNATAFVIGVDMDPRPVRSDGFPFVSDAYLQETAGRTNVFISGNPWNYGGDPAYDMAAASFDAAVRDAVPEVPGSQALTYVFPAGNSGGAQDDGTGGNPDSIWSPGTSKNVITVGAIEQKRNITNKVVIGGVTNAVFQAETDSSNQVASFSGRGNVGVGTESGTGRFKPDVVAPGTFVISDKPTGTNWDPTEYYNPTNFTGDTQFNQSVETNGLAPYSFFLPLNAVALAIIVQSNDFSPSPFPNMPIYVKVGDNPDTNSASGYDFLGTNILTLPVSGLIAGGSQVFYSIANGGNQIVDFDVSVVVETTNDNGNYLTVLSNMNSGLGPYYRYETGTSMAVASVTGTLALMQQFLEQRMGLTNHSPALMKALLINGARTVASQYDFQVNGTRSSQGWGLPNLSNSIPGSLTNTGATNMALQFFDQNPTNALATGQSKTRLLKLATNANTQPLRFTLVWTDPPGNPAAGVKLVNSLELIVTNLDNPTNVTVFYGNDIPAGSGFNQFRSSSNAPAFDLVNNVQNVYLFPPLGTNYSVTVYARRVNVNAVTANTNNVVQDYALVMSYGDGGVASNAFTVTDGALVSSNTPTLTVVSNGAPLLNERVGANSQFSGSTNGIANQWNFYVFTNDVSGTNSRLTNVAFVTFSPPNLAVPRMGTREEANPANGVRVEADDDMYVSTDPNLTNLNPATLAAANKSLTRTGTEKVLLTNTTGGKVVYYIGIKSEDQEGAQYGFFAGALSNSFGQLDSNGNVVLTILTALPQAIPPGTPAHPGSLTVLAVTTEPYQARKVVVTDTVTHQDFGDLIGAETHLQNTAVLNNHSLFTNFNDSTETFTYDDSGESDPLFPGARHTDGPGSLNDFMGDAVSDGIWTFTMVNDSSPGDQGSLDFLKVVIEPQSPSNETVATIPGKTWFYDFVDVPAAATNLTVTVQVISTNNPGPVNLYLRRGSIPDQNNFDKAALDLFPGGSLSLSIFDSPPLNPGRYFIGVFNPNASPETVDIKWTLGIAAGAGQPFKYLSPGNEPLLDDAVTDSIIQVQETNTVSSVEVGLRIDHPRESDLQVTLISPSGTRALLVENRGGLDTNGFGSGTNSTNVSAPLAAGDLNASTNVIGVATNQGTIVINYNFFTIPDDLRIYYDGNRIFDTGLVSGASTISVDFGPGNSTNVTIVMNEPGTNPQNTNNSTDQWQYQATEITRGITYAVFTDDTNKTTTPIKFAVPPFGHASAFLPTTTNMTSSFESSAAGVYSNTVVDGWTVVNSNNPVTVVTVTALASNENSSLAGSNILALHNGALSRTLTNLIPGTSYTLSFLYHGRPVDGPVGWWRGEDYTDTSGNNNNGIGTGDVSIAPGLVGNAFSFGDVNGTVTVADSPSLRVTNQITTEAWINTLDATTDHGIISKVGPLATVGNNGYQFELFSVGEMSALFNSPGQAWPSQRLDTPIPIVLSTWTHVAWTYDQNTMCLYFNGQLIASSIIGSNNIIATNNALRISGDDNDHIYFNGLIDESAIYSNALSILQIQDIYAAGSAGKTLSPATTVSASVTLPGTSTNITAGDAWNTETIAFIATNTNALLTIAALQDGMLVDSFQLIVTPQPNPANYYLPEESLSQFTGEKAQGKWTLEVLDNRVGATNPQPNLVSWALNLGLNRINPSTIPLQNLVPNTNAVPQFFSAYYSVFVPPWATNATNILVTADGPVNVIFNQNVLPGTNASDVVLLNSVTNGSATLTVGGVPPLIPGQEYYLAVQNLTNTTEHFTIEVAFNLTIIPLTNDQVFTTNFSPLQAMNTFFSFPVTNAPAAALFELYNLNGDVDLTVDQNTYPFSPPFFASSANPGTSREQIVLRTNGTLPNLNAVYYLGVPNNTSSNVTFTIHAVVVNTNGLLVSTAPLNPIATLPGPGATTGPTLSWSTVVGECYEVDYSSDLATWTPLPGTPFQATTTTSFATDPTPISGIPARFYRILQVACP